MHDIPWFSASELAALYRSRQLSPVEVIDSLLSRIEIVNPSINSFVTVTDDIARRAARRAEQQFMTGEAAPPLLGVPVTVKDLTDTAGIRTTYGCTLYKDHVPEHDAISWSRIQRAGAVLVGKTTTPEFGLLGTTESYLTGVTSNPWDTSRTSGGSSGGAAASTASGFAPIAWGSDGGGSIRVPAALCGVVGFKPSLGRVPMADNSDPATTEGPLARSVLDVALLLDVTAGRDHRDRFSLPDEGISYATAAREIGDVSGLRIAASPDLGAGTLDAETRRVFAESMGQLRSAGAIVEEVHLELPEMQDYFVSYWGPEYVDVVAELESAGASVWPLIEHIAGRARTLTATQVSTALRRTRTGIYNSFMAVLGEHDILITPTTPLPAPLHSDVAVLGDGFGVAGELHRLTESPTHAGLPAMSVPAGFTHDGLPVGLQIIGQPLGDYATIQASASIEQVLGLRTLRPQSLPS